MPRSGSTIIASAVNSLDDDTLIIGEPHRMAASPRPPSMSATPNLIDTRHGLFDLFPTSAIDADVLTQIEVFSKKRGVGKYGFKECLTTEINPIKLVADYGSRVDFVAVAVRDPRRNYMSVIQSIGHGRGPYDIAAFTDAYVSLINYTWLQNVSTVILEWFKEDPVKELRRATGWQWIPDKINLCPFPGGGDTYARTSKKINSYERRGLYLESDIVPALDAYIDLLDKLEEIMGQ